MKHYLDTDGVTILWTKVKNYVSDNTNRRVKLFSEVDATSQSEKGTVYINAEDVNNPIYAIGDGNAYIIDLPKWNIGEIDDIVQELKAKSITSSLEDETLQLSYIITR